MTIDKEYTSDLSVSFCFTSMTAFPTPRSSGSQYRIVPSLRGVEALTDSIFSVIEHREKSERRGQPFASMSIFDWEKGYVNQEDSQEKLKETPITPFRFP